MSEKTLKTRIRSARKTEAEWASLNPVLLSGEVAYSSDVNGKYKIGDGSSTWSQLPYAIPVTKADIGLGNVENKSSATIRGELTKANVTNALGYTPPTTNTTYGVATSSTLGLVKSGTDITVDSSGNVSVKDDSHNHVISNVDGLQDKLNLKAENGTLTNQDLNTVTTPGFYNAGGGNTVTNKPSGVNNFGLIVIHRASGSYYTQIIFNDTSSYRRFCVNGTWGSWTQDKLTDTNTWRDIQNNLTSTSTTDSLSANQGRLLANGSARDDTKLPLSGGTLTGDVALPITKSFLDASLPVSGATMSISDITSLSNYKTYLGSYQHSGTWYNLISTRHRNGAGDGTGYGMYFRSTLTSSSNLTWGKQYGENSWQAERTILDSSNYTSYAATKNHTHTLLSNLYSSRPTSADLTATGSGGLSTFKSTSAMTTGKPAGSGHILHFYWDNTGGYDSQLAISNTGAFMQYRGMNSGTWGSWKTLLDSSNYNTYAPSKTGTGASGTWEINVSGSAAKLTTARTISLTGSVLGSGSFDGSGDLSISTTTNHTHDDRYYTESEMDTKLNAKLNTSLKGTASGLAELDSTGRVPSSQLPSYVDDVIEGYLYNSKFYKESEHTTVITGESGKIYVDLTSNKTYRWSGSAFTVISETLALGETSTTAYRGDRGKIAYDHSQVAHAPSNAEVNQNAFSNVVVGSTTIAADSKTDTLTLVAGSNVTLTPDATNDKITISSTDTNDKVTQTAVTDSSYTNWRSLIWGASNSGTEGFTPTTVTDSVFSCTGLSVQPSTGTIRASVFKGNLSGNATSATKLTTSAGSATQPVYFSDGKPVVCTYTLGKSVPSDAVFTDKNVYQSVTTTANYRPLVFGATNNADTSTLSASTTGQVYVTTTMYAQPSTGMIASTSHKIGEHVTLQYNSSTESLDFVFS